jgi:hypothetical protein
VSEQIRTAVQADVPAMTALASIRRDQYARYQPLFWRPASAAPGKHRTYLGGLVASDEIITLVSEEAGQLTGYLFATLDPAPHRALVNPGPPPAPRRTGLPEDVRMDIAGTTGHTDALRSVNPDSGLAALPAGRCLSDDTGLAARSGPYRPGGLVRCWGVVRAGLNSSQISKRSWKIRVPR